MGWQVLVKRKEGEWPTKNAGVRGLLAPTCLSVSVLTVPEKVCTVAGIAWRTWAPGDCTAALRSTREPSGSRRLTTFDHLHMVGEARPTRRDGRRLNATNDTACLVEAPFVELPSRKEMDFDAAAVLGGVGFGVASMAALFGVHKILLCLRARGDGDVARGLQSLWQRKRGTLSPAEKE
ncbi:unnamed protein product [Durusdinium trenchii]|uniref:Uncharacterized protein n=1 Tax=Durusdinium trenchii TaxID=1381693 RepID=A0ABP0SFA1_9DINO